MEEKDINNANSIPETEGNNEKPPNVITNLKQCSALTDLPKTKVKALPNARKGKMDLYKHESLNKKFEQKKRPFSAKAKLVSFQISTETKGMSIKNEIQSQKKRPQSAIVKGSQSNSYQNENASKERQFAPLVYGYNSKAHLCGEELLKATSPLEQPNRTKNRPNNIPKMKCKSNSTLDSWHTVDGDNTIAMPATLRPLEPWLSQDFPDPNLGADTPKCLVFLPSLTQQWKDLPIVPDPQQADEEIQYSEKILPPNPRVIKRYEHPSLKNTYPDEWQCSHKKTRVHNQLRIFSSEGNLLHESHRGVRTIEVVRKEIQELEDLMKGIGDENGTCLFVQYQAEINQIQRMLDKSRGRVDEILRKEQERLMAEEPEDTFGLRAFCQDHDEVIQKIKEHHRKCIEELAMLEEELEIETARAHFKQKYRQDQLHAVSSDIQYDDEI